MDKIKVQLHNWDEKGCEGAVEFPNGLYITGITFATANMSVNLPSGVCVALDDNGYSKLQDELDAAVTLEYRTALGMYGPHPATPVKKTKLRISYTMAEIKSAPPATHDRLAFGNLPKEIQEEVKRVHNEVIMTCEGGSASKWEDRFCDRISNFIDGDGRKGKKFFGNLHDYYCDVKRDNEGVKNIAILYDKMI